jgi:hypothetical protein
MEWIGALVGDLGLPLGAAAGFALASFLLFLALRASATGLLYLSFHGVTRVRLAGGAPSDLWGGAEIVLDVVRRRLSFGLVFCAAAIACWLALYYLRGKYDSVPALVRFEKMGTDAAVAWMKIKVPDPAPIAEPALYRSPEPAANDAKPAVKERIRSEPRPKPKPKIKPKPTPKPKTGAPPAPKIEDALPLRKSVDEPKAPAHDLDAPYVPPNGEPSAGDGTPTY